MSNVVFDKFGTNPPHICTYCNYRHDGICSDDDVYTCYDMGYCKNFVLGRCFTCSVYLGNRGHESSICPAYIDFEGCGNYKS